MRLNRQDYLKKVAGCWLGKSIGGTIGAPFEWFRQVNDVSFYIQDLKGEPVPNDDLDLQLVWLYAMENHGIDVNSRTLSDYWLNFVTPHWAEYGTGKTHLRNGLPAPLSGSVDNEFKDSCGAFIRSEIWACIAPGLPEIAARYAYEDAIVDHGDGEGTYAEVFVAAMQSAAFIVSDLRELITLGLSYIPADCGTAEAVKMVVKLVDEGKDWLTIRDEILQHHRGAAFFRQRANISDEDFDKGFFDGILGYDAPSNIAILVLGLLVGGDDFAKVMCTTVNCGEDTDCTGATVGALWGIIHGVDAIPQEWVEPIGTEIKTLCINIAEIQPPLPKTVEELTERTARIASQVLLRHNATHLMSDEPTDLSDVSSASLHCSDQGSALYQTLNGPRFDFEFFEVYLDYGDGPYVVDGQSKKIRLTIRNKRQITSVLSMHWYLADGWTVSPSSNANVLAQQKVYDRPVVLEYEFSCEKIPQLQNRFVLEITAVNRACVMHIPLILVEGNVCSKA